MTASQPSQPAALALDHISCPCGRKRGGTKDQSRHEVGMILVDCRWRVKGYTPDRMSTSSEPC